MVEVPVTGEFEDWYLDLVDADAREVDPMRVNKWNDLRARKLSPDALRQVDEEIGKELLEMDLRALREAAELTQDELAERIEITQSQLSKLERRDDHRLSTLKRYVAALGGELEVVAVVQGKRVRLSDV